MGAHRLCAKVGPNVKTGVDEKNLRKDACEIFQMVSIFVIRVDACCIALILMTPVLPAAASARKYRR